MLRRMMGPDLVKERPTCALTPVQAKAPLMQQDVVSSRAQSCGWNVSFCRLIALCYLF
jgi:hypothetical protein